MDFQSFFKSSNSFFYTFGSLNIESVHWQLLAHQNGHILEIQGFVYV